MISISQQQEGAVHAETLAGCYGRQGDGEYLFQVNGALQDKAEFVQKADFEGFVIKETDQGLNLGFLALMLIVDQAENGCQRVSAFAEAVQVLFEINAVTAFFQDTPAPGRQ
jgi:hypothetical protein